MQVVHVVQVHQVLQMVQAVAQKHLLFLWCDALLARSLLVTNKVTEIKCKGAG